MLSNLQQPEPRKIPYPTHSLAWAAEGLWSLENGVKLEVKPIVPAKKAAPQAIAEGGPFGPIPHESQWPYPKPPNEVLAEEPSYWDRPTHYSVLRLRKLDAEHTIALERPISFSAREMVVSQDGQTVVLLNYQQAEVFAAPDWISVARWKFTRAGQTDNSYADEISQFLLSPDGRTLAVGRSNGFPQFFETRTGKILQLGAGHSNQIAALNFADATNLRTRDWNGAVVRWDVRTGRELPAQMGDEAFLPIGEDDRHIRHASDFRAEDGLIWQIMGRNGGKYRSYESFEIRRLAKGAKPPSEFEPAPQGTPTIGAIETKWGQTSPNGLVPGNKWLHIGTRVFNRADLTPISAVNVHGEIDQLQFSSDGERYTLLTTERESRPSGIVGITFREEVDQRVRVHDTRSGETLFCIPTKGVEHLALSPDQKRVAVVNDQQQLQVWQIE